MDHFTVVEDACAIIYSRGFYSQVDVYSRGDNYYAKVGARFVRLMKYSQTTVPAIRWYEGEGFDITVKRLAPAPLVPACSAPVDLSRVVVGSPGLRAVRA